VPEGEGKIIRYNLIRQTVTLEMTEGQEVELSLSQLPPSPPPKETEETDPEG
jgi:hypothetical protein